MFPLTILPFFIVANLLSGPHMPSIVSRRFIYYDRCIYVAVTVNGHRNLLFLLDTGANVSAIDQTAARKLDLPIVGSATVEGTAGTIPVRKGHLRRIAIGSMAARGLEVTVQDLSGTLSPPGMRVDGILGYDFLHSFSLAIDYADSTLTITKGGSQLTGTPSPVAVPFEIDNGIPRLRMMLDDSVAVDLRVDTGASLFATDDIYINITESAWKGLRELDSTLAPGTYFKGSGPAGEITLPVARIRNARLGGVTIQRPYVIVQPAVGYFARADAAGFIGNNLLEKFSPVLIDYRHRILVLTSR
jgi:predicted aspartyl protease